MEPTIGSVVAGKYVLLRGLASGGMGELWVARHNGLDCEVGVKFMRELDGADSVKRFEFEARTAAKVRGRHVVHTYDFGFHEKRPYLVMELLHGETLGQWMQREGPQRPRDALRWLEQLAKGLRQVHEAGIVHRDIKPSNVFVTHEGDDRFLKLLDFGIAKSNEPGAETASNVRVLGSPGYMSPEQARGQAIDTRSDLWSIAVIAYELLSGRALFAARHPGDAIARVCTMPIPDLSDTIGLSASFDKFFARALARSPNSRFDDISAFIASFRHACDCDKGVACVDSSDPPIPGRDGPTLAIRGNESGTRSGAIGLSIERSGSGSPQRLQAVVPGLLSVTAVLAASFWLPAVPVQRGVVSPSAGAAVSADGQLELAHGNWESVTPRGETLGGTAATPVAPRGETLGGTAASRVAPRGTSNRVVSPRPSKVDRRARPHIDPVPSPALAYDEFSGLSYKVAK